MLELQVKLKEAVKKDQILGYVYPLNGKPRMVVKAEMSGKVVFLRRKASIEKGEGIMALAPIRGKL
jgi:predicted deacylase